MDDLEEIKKRKLEALQNQQEAQQQEQQLAQQLEQLEAIVKPHLTKDAIQRWGNVKAAHPEKAVQVLVFLGQAIQKGEIKETINDEQLKELLKRLTPEKKEIKIKRV